MTQAKGIEERRIDEHSGRIEGKKIAVWFSCGAASAVAAYETIRRYGGANEVRVINNPVREEDSDNQRFLRDVSAWLGCEIERAINDVIATDSAVDVWERRSYMAGIKGAPCTYELKKKARIQWEREHLPDFHVLGFTSEERQRHARFTLTERDNVLPVLIDAGYSKADCFRIITEAGILLPAVYSRGYPNANCIGCVKATSPSYWNHVRKDSPHVFAERAEQSRRIGARLVRHKGKRIFLDELPREAKGRPMKTMSVECGIFCEEKEEA